MKQFRIIMAAALALLSAVPASSQQAVELKQQSLGSLGIGSANYSGITPLGNNRYAIVSDKEPADGFFILEMGQDPTSGQISYANLVGFYQNPSPETDANGMSIRDCEGIVYHNASNTVFISGEGDQEILEYSMEGHPTGRKLTIPAIFALRNIVPNYGFEALGYDKKNGLFWTTTESTLLADGACASAEHPNNQNLLRLQSFGEDFLPKAQYAYRMDRGRSEDFGKTYVYGVPAITALQNGKLLILEREANISNGYLSSTVRCKLFLVDPNTGWQIDSSTDLKKLDPNRFLIKTLLADFTTKLTPFNLSFANYEGMCLGRKLSDGRQTIIMISDSQNGFGIGPVKLKDYVKVLVLPDEVM